MYTIERLQKVLGKDKIDPAKDYVIETHLGAGMRMGFGGYREVGSVPDYSLNEKGTMIVLEKIPPKVPVVVKRTPPPQPKKPELRKPELRKPEPFKKPEPKKLAPKKLAPESKVKAAAKPVANPNHPSKVREEGN